jgi:hypothetical protein
MPLDRRREVTKGLAGDPSYREAKGDAFDFFHYKNPVRTITDF